MATLKIVLPEPVDAAFAERVKTSGARSKEEYLIGLVEADCAAGALDQVLAERMRGSFAPLESDWRERVRGKAAGRAGM